MATIGSTPTRRRSRWSVIDATGRECGARTFPNDHEGHLTLLHWVQELAAERRFGIMERRTAEGKSRLDALRCLKRHLADVVLRTMLADAERSAEPVTLGT